MYYGTAYRRFLPHYQNSQQTYFITFCTRDRRILSSEARDIVLKQIVDHDGVLFYLQTAVVMPDHVHLLLTPIDSSLGDIMRRIKGASAHSINRMLNEPGPLWQREYFDRQIRSSENLRAKGEYIANNPVRAGIVAVADDYAWLWRVWVDHPRLMEHRL